MWCLTTARAVTAIEEITGVIEEITSYQTTIAAVVEEQTATTSEMSRNVSQAADRSGQITASITAVAAAAGVTAGQVDDALTTANDLARVAGELKTLVATFRY